MAVPWNIFKSEKLTKPSLNILLTAWSYGIINIYIVLYIYIYIGIRKKSKLRQIYALFIDLFVIYLLKCDYANETSWPKLAFSLISLASISMLVCWWTSVHMKSWFKQPHTFSSGNSCLVLNEIMYNKITIKMYYISFCRFFWLFPMSQWVLAQCREELLSSQACWVSFLSWGLGNYFGSILYSRSMFDHHYSHSVIQAQIYPCSSS